jgi:hypothetical protein
MEGTLEAHCGGDAGKDLAVDGGRQTGAEKTGLENKHKQEKWKTTRNQQNKKKKKEKKKKKKKNRKGAQSG